MSTSCGRLHLPPIFVLFVRLMARHAQMDAFGSARARIVVDMIFGISVRALLDITDHGHQLR